MNAEAQRAVLFICSSRRHLYQAAGLALGQAGPAYLLVVDQTSSADDPTVAALRREPGLFAGVDVLAKDRNRADFRAVLQRCQEIVSRINPIEIFTGNDRKYAFQYAMRCVLEKNPDCRGIYMDDGTGSYESGIHLNFWRGLMDQTVVAWTKRLVIGPWYERARYFGGCRWVHECRVQHPQLLPEPIRQSKQVRALPADVFRDPATLEVLERCFLNDRADRSTWEACDALVVLPLSKQVPVGGVAFERFVAAIREACAGCRTIGIKYHPRERREYLPAQPGDVLIDRDIPAEILFSRGALRCIVGDTSSALLSAQWLQTKAEIVSLCPQGERDKPLPRLLARAGIRIQLYSV